MKSPMSELNDFTEETSKIKARYKSIDANGCYSTVWAPFHELEAAYRSQQLLAFSGFMREAGIHTLAGRRILDVGCGQGRILRSFVDMGAEPGNLYGVDLSEQYLDNAHRLSPGARVTLTNGQHLDFGEATFDLVTQYVVFSSISLPGLRNAMAMEMLRVLKPGGYIFWWDLLRTVEEAGRQVLNPETLFSTLPFRCRQVAWLPRPVDCVAKRRWKWTVGWFVNLFAARPTHLAALIGPKP
jgi:ubiquinone/menaquinone biosynthesis C-methylase UbiE